jgi:hypothetical protein
MGYSFSTTFEPTLAVNRHTMWHSSDPAYLAPSATSLAGRAGCERQQRAFVLSLAITRFSREVSKTATENCSRRLIVSTRSICVSKRASRRKFPLVSRMISGVGGVRQGNARGSPAPFQQEPDVSVAEQSKLMDKVDSGKELWTVQRAFRRRACPRSI